MLPVVTRETTAGRTLTDRKSRAAKANQARAKTADDERPLFEAIAMLCDQAEQCSKLRSIISRAIASIVSKPEAEDRYAKAVMAIVDENDYDGIDLDWEYPDTEQEIIGFKRLTRRFRKELDAIGAKKGRPMFVTMAASSNPGTLKWLGKEFLLETMDWINVMTYDFTGDWTNYAGHHSPLFASSKQPGGSPRSTESTMKYLLEERGLPADRLAVGIFLAQRHRRDAV